MLNPQYVPQLQQSQMLPYSYQFPINQHMSYQPNQITNGQFDMLKNKLDTIQMEMIDIVRHLKEYTKRYMAAVREDDMTKIDEYIKELIDVDKKINKAQTDIDKQKEDMEEKNQEEELKQEANEGIISKTTNGIKNVMSGLGNNMGAISGIIKGTTDMANSYLSKNVISTPEDSTNTKKKESNNDNEMSVEEYINEKNKTKETAKPETPKPETAKPETPKPETAKPETSKPETPKPETLRPETPKPETPKPETPKPETPKPETSKPETPKPETPKPETPKPETPKAETLKAVDTQEPVEEQNPVTNELNKDKQTKATSIKKNVEIETEIKKDMEGNKNKVMIGGKRRKGKSKLKKNKSNKKSKKNRCN